MCKHWFHQIARFALLPLLPLMLCNACSEDEEPLAPYVQELSDVRTDEFGAAVRLTRDNGQGYEISNRVKGLKPDTTYRALVVFTQGDQSVHLTGFSPVLAPAPKKYAASQVKLHPLEAMAIWRGADYVNLRLKIKGTTNGVHYFGFHQGETTVNADGSQTMEIRLIHDQNGDPLYVSREAYLSLPLAPLRKQLQVGRDSVCLQIMTFNGRTQHTLAF